MQIARTLFAQLVNLLATDAAKLAATADDVVVLKFITADFTLSPNLIAAELTLDDGTVASPGVINMVDEASSQFRDPNSGDYRVYKRYEDNPQILFTGGVPGGAIYGMALMSNDLSQLHAVEKFPAPQVFSTAGLGVDLPNVDFRFPIAMVS